ncbi:hypothetical protein D3C87_351350 [compost metagenome]
MWCNPFSEAKKNKELINALESAIASLIEYTSLYGMDESDEAAIRLYRDLRLKYGLKEIGRNDRLSPISAFDGKCSGEELIFSSLIMTDSSSPALNHDESLESLLNKKGVWFYPGKSEFAVFLKDVAHKAALESCNYMGEKVTGSGFWRPKKKCSVYEVRLIISLGQDTNEKGISTDRLDSEELSLDDHWKKTEPHAVAQMIL